MLVVIFIDVGLNKNLHNFLLVLDKLKLSLKDTTKIKPKPNFSCEICGARFFYEKSLKKHMRGHSDHNDHGVDGYESEGDRHSMNFELVNIKCNFTSLQLRKIE